MINMESTVAHAFHRFALAILGLALPVALVAYGGNGDSRKAAPLAPKAAALGRSMPETPTGDVLTISSPAFADGAPIPEQYTCKGANIAPPLTWSAPFGGALVVDDPDAPREPYVHWIVIGIAPGAGSTADGETPGGGISLPNSSGQPAYTGPCTKADPPAIPRSSGSIPDYAEQLRTADLRVTRPRVAVLEAVNAHPHADTETIFGAVRFALPDVSRQAVYDVLHALTAAGLVRKIQPSGSVARYESRVGDNHHHIVCRSCGVIADVDCAVGEAPCLTASDHNGFLLDEAEVIYWGLCPDCSISDTSRSHP